MEHNQNFLSNELTVDAAAQNHLKETAMWAKFLGITGFVMSTIFLLIAIFAGTFFSRVMEQQPTAGPNPFASMGAGIFAAVYGFISLISFGLSYIVFRFGVKTQAGLRSADQSSLNAGLLNLKLLFRIHGIIIIIYLGFIVLAIVFGAVSALMAR